MRLRPAAAAIALAVAAGCGDRAPPRETVDPGDPLSVVAGFLADVHALEVAELHDERASADWTTDAHRERCVSEWIRRGRTEFEAPRIEPEAPGGARVVSVVRREPSALTESERPRTRFLFHLSEKDGGWRILEVHVETDDGTRRRLHPPE